MDKALAHISEDGTRTQTSTSIFPAQRALPELLPHPLVQKRRPNTPRGCMISANTAPPFSSGWRAVLQPTTRPPVHRKR